MTTSTTYTDENKKTSNKDKIRNVRYENSTHLITILSPNNCNCHIWKTLVSVKKKILSRSSDKCQNCLKLISIKVML